MKDDTNTYLMDTHSYAILDYYRIRDTVAGFCMSLEAKETLQERIPCFDSGFIHRHKELSTNWLTAFSVKPSLFKGWQPVSQYFSVLQTEGASLSLEALSNISQFCQAVEHVRKAVLPLEKECSIFYLAETIKSLPDMNEALSEISKVLDKDGNLRDLPELRDIRRSISAVKQNIEARIRFYTTQSDLKEVLQSELPTIRGERQVLALKANFKGRVKGIVHEVSQTGQTLFVEPEDVVQLNNSLVEEEFRLKREELRILRDLTARLGDFKREFRISLDIMLELDVTYAASRWGDQNKCTFAQKKEVLTLKQARHPLLGNTAVPIDILFSQNQRVLIITGANTGGKTVALKTIALCALLNQSGFPIPAAEGSTLPLFDNVFADIGDEQSIDNSLSTFSGHMKNVAQIAELATKNSLILLDELGSGTDTQEGGAIAMAILDYLLQKKSLVLVTTHHGILKNYGYTHEECSNASVEFDESTLAPAYRIVMGIPGESHALDIARKSGLPAQITDNATNYMGNNQADVTALIKGLTLKHEQLEESLKQARDDEQSAHHRLERAKRKELELKEREAQLKEVETRNISEFTKESRRLLENLVRELREGEINREKTLKAKQFISELEENLNKERETAALLQENLAESRKKIQNSNQHIDSSELSAGDSVYVLANLADTKQMRGELIRQDKKGNWIVQVGALKLTKKAELLRAAPKEKLTASVSVESVTNASGETIKPSYELRLLGMNLEQALKELEQQIDRATIQGLHDFSVIHGKGHGILQKGVHNYLKNCPVVAEFAFAHPDAGGAGKTFVKLK